MLKNLIEKLKAKLKEWLKKILDCGCEKKTEDDKGVVDDFTRNFDSLNLPQTQENILSNSAAGIIHKNNSQTALGVH